MADKNEFNKKNTIFYMVDMQNDFTLPTGKLYVPKAETIVDRLTGLNRYAEQKGIKRFASRDRHFYSDAEISDKPDWKDTFPAHCMDGTPGAEIVDDLRADDALYIENKINENGDLKHYSPARLEMLVKESGQIVFEKQATDIASNPYFRPAIEILKKQGVRNAVVYGIATDFCVKAAVNRLHEAGLNVYLVEDAVKGIIPEQCEKTLDDFKEIGVRMIGMKDIPGINLLHINDLPKGAPLQNWNYILIDSDGVKIR